MLLKLAKTLIKISPDKVGYGIAKILAARTQRPRITAEESDALSRASKIHYGTGNKNVARAWGKGPLVILVHGWSGQAAQMAPLAMHIASLGFRAVAIDVTGHGDSAGSTTRWDHFLNDVSGLSRQLNEDVFSYVAHSAGALSVMAARKLRGIHASRYVCICAPSHPYPPIEVIQKKLAPAKNIIERYQAYIAKQFEETWDALESGISFDGASKNTLLFYDQTDRFVNHAEGDKIHALNPETLLIKTNGYSHTRILQAPELFKVVTDFLKA